MKQSKLIQIDGHNRVKNLSAYWLPELTLCRKIDGTIYSANSSDMVSMDNSLLALYKAGKIDAREALQYATNPEMLKRKM